MQNFTSTRDVSAKSNFEHALLEPNAPARGLWTLKSLPQIDFSQLASLSYTDLTRAIFQALELDIDGEILSYALESYASFDVPQNPAPLSIISPDLALLELYHGSSRAFKDMALAPFGRLFSRLAQKQGQNYLILTATSGDTGPATLNTFANLENIQVVCLYPKGGTSQVQELQMTTQEAKNLHIFGIKGNFDDAQSTLKSLIHDADFKSHLKAKNLHLSVANSVNFGRIAFQIVYHVWGYLQYLKAHDLPFGVRIQPIIPSGNFGNALGAFYAKKMGLPLEKILIASNPNNILTEFIQTGRYDISDKTLLLTLSPAMDILKSSNVERVLFALFGANRTAELLSALESSGSYSLTQAELQALQEDFGAVFCSDASCLEIIRDFYHQGVLIDPHTANGIFAYRQSKSAHNIVCSTAQWCKFAPTLYQALHHQRIGDQEAIEQILRDTKSTLPASIMDLFTKTPRHQEVLEIGQIQGRILQALA